MKLLQIDFKSDGPWGNEMAEVFNTLAANIAEAEGLIWKIWTENREEQVAGGIYLFKNQRTLDAYLALHLDRLHAFGITEITAKKFDVNEPLTAITKGKHLLAETGQVQR